MFEAFILSVVMCTPNAQTTAQCQTILSPMVHSTEEECVTEFIERAIPWVESQGNQAVSFSCGPYELPFPLGNDS